jgi:hypothetical protein
LRQALFFEMSFDKALSLEDAVDVASDLQDLVTIGTHRTAAFDYLHLYNADVFTEGQTAASARRLRGFSCPGTRAQMRGSGGRTATTCRLRSTSSAGWTA